jgi:hypothetical protein
MNRTEEPIACALRMDGVPYRLAIPARAIATAWRPAS